MPNKPSQILPRMYLQPRATDKQLVLGALGHFDGFHVGASTPAHLVGFVQDIGKPFFVDPMAYMFALAPEQVVDRVKGTVRQSMSALAGRYSSIFAKAVGKEAVTPDALTSSRGALADLTYNALDYQRTKFQSDEPVLINEYYDKYDAFESEGVPVEHSLQATEPLLLATPFFLARDLADPWYSVNLACARIATEHKKSNERLYAALFLSREMLERADVLRIVADYADRGLDGVLLWINGMSEESASPEALANLVSLVRGFQQIGKPVIKLYGGYLSILMHEYGLVGFSCGLGAKSFRDVLAYKWMAPGPPKPKFYVPALHQSYPLDEAEHLLKAYPFLRCECALCGASYGRDLDRFVGEMRKDGYCQTHFLNARKRELQAFSQGGITEAARAIDATIDRLGKKNATGVRHLAKWRNLIAGERQAGVGLELLPKVRSLEGQFIRRP